MRRRMPDSNGLTRSKSRDRVSARVSRPEKKSDDAKCVEHRVKGLGLGVNTDRKPDISINPNPIEIARSSFPPCRKIKKQLHDALSIWLFTRY